MVRSAYVKPAEMLVRAVREAAEAAFPGCEIGFEERIKGNGVRMTGLIVREPGRDCVPIVYMDPRFVPADEEDARREASLLVERYKEARLVRMDAEEVLSDPETKLEVHAANTALNTERLDGVIRKELGEITLYLFFRTGRDSGCLFRHTMLEQVHMTEEEAWKRGCENTASRRRTGYLYEIMGETEEENAARKQVYMVTSAHFRYGAAVFFLSPEVRREIREKLGGDYYALPASVHEILAVRADHSDPGYLLETVRMANRDTVSEEEYLSGCIFFVGEDLRWKTIRAGDACAQEGAEACRGNGRIPEEDAEENRAVGAGTADGARPETGKGGADTDDLQDQE
ncbi:MAG: hypothetical protein J6Z23_08530 [Lachnospiraceae bacterium]|nr:hypothetical protein [Lachnospiraceae bacterium]